MKLGHMHKWHSHMHYYGCQIIMCCHNAKINGNKFDIKRHNWLLLTRVCQLPDVLTFNSVKSASCSSHCIGVNVETLWLQPLLPALVMKVWPYYCSWIIMQHSTLHCAETALSGMLGADASKAAKLKVRT